MCSNYARKLDRSSTGLMQIDLRTLICRGGCHEAIGEFTQTQLIKYQDLRQASIGRVCKRSVTYYCHYTSCRQVSLEVCNL